MKGQGMYETMVMAVVVTCALVAVLPDPTTAQEYSWKPQGRFGKRTGEALLQLGAASQGNLFRSPLRSPAHTVHGLKLTYKC